MSLTTVADCLRCAEGHESEEDGELVHGTGGGDAGGVLLRLCHVLLYTREIGQSSDARRS